MDSIMKNDALYLYLRHGFYEDYIDNKPYLFAFKNHSKVYDFKSKELRYIKPDDYIMTNTGYDYPEYIEDETRLTIKLDRLIVLSKSSLLGWFLHVSLIVIIKGRSPMEVSMIVIINQV
jgi:hypothetical protein